MTFWGELENLKTPSRQKGKSGRGGGAYYSYLTRGVITSQGGEVLALKTGRGGTENDEAEGKLDQVCR